MSERNKLFERMDQAERNVASWPAWKKGAPSNRREESNIPADGAVERVSDGQHHTVQG